MKRKIFWACMSLSLAFVLISVIAVSGFHGYDLPALAIISGISILIGASGCLAMQEQQHQAVMDAAFRPRVYWPKRKEKTK